MTEFAAKNLVALLEQRAESDPSAVLYTFLDRAGQPALQVTYLDLYRTARVIAAELQRRKLTRQPVALIYPQGPDFIAAFFGAILAGTYPMPMAKPRGKDWRAIEVLLSSTRTKGILTTSNKDWQIPSGVREQSQLQIIATDVLDPGLADEWRRPVSNPQDIAFIQYTSGSTSQPKGVVISHANVLHNSELIRRNLENESCDIGVSWLPFFHDMGLIGHVIQPLYTRIHNYFLSPVVFIAQPRRWLEAISRFGGTISGGPNFAFELCCNKLTAADLEGLDLSRWRLMYCGAERISAKTIESFTAKFAVAGLAPGAFYACYGMAEATLFVSGRKGAPLQRHAADGLSHVAVGSDSCGSTIEIVDPGNDQPVAAGAIGEICIKSASVASEYFENPDATARTFGQLAAKDGSYMRTGDLGMLIDGDLYFVGRLKNLIKLRGSSYHAEDIEAAVYGIADLAGIARCVAFGVPHEAQEGLVVLFEQEAQIPRERAEELVHAEICQRIGIIPQLVLAVRKHALPLTTSGKLQRNACRDNYLKGMYDELVTVELNSRERVTEHLTTMGRVS